MVEVPRTGIWLFPEAPAPSLVDIAVAAEAAGFDELWLGDEGPAREPFAVLAAAAAATTSIRLCVGITNPYVRHPALAASSALTVHELSGGRFVLGVGAGGQLSLGPFRLAADKPVERIGGFIETVRAVGARRASPDYEPAGKAIDDSVADNPLPVYVGARGPRLNRLASAVADGAFVAGLPPFRYDQVIGWAREHRPIDIALYPSVAFDASAVEHHRPEMIWSLIDAPAEVCRSLGVDEAELRAAADAMRAGRSEPARALITDELLPQLMLVGGADDVGRRLAELVRTYRPASIGLALLQEDLQAGVAGAAKAFTAMREALESAPP